MNKNEIVDTRTNLTIHCVFRQMVPWPAIHSFVGVAFGMIISMYPL
jgi:hypothetical protein